MRRYLERYGRVWEITDDTIFCGDKLFVKHIPFSSKKQIDAAMHLILDTSRFRQSFAINGLYVAGDLHYKSQEELERILV